MAQGLQDRKSGLRWGWMSQSPPSRLPWSCGRSCPASPLRRPVGGFSGPSMSRFHSLCGRWMIWSRHICWRRQCPKFLGPRGNYRGLLPEFRDLPSLQMILQFAASFRTAEVWHRHSDRLFRKIRPNSATR